MGLITRDASAKSTRSAVTIIAEGNKFTGEMSIVGKMHIDGHFDGKISSLDTISIGMRGEVSGVVKAHKINVCGLLEGEIHCDELTIEDGGKVRGVVFSEELVIEKKGCFVGERQLKKQQESLSSSAAAQQDRSESGAPLDPAFQDLPDRVTLIEKPSLDKSAAG